MGAIAIPSRPATILDLAERLTGLLAQTSIDQDRDLSDRVREEVADLAEALSKRVRRKAERDPRSLFELDDRLIDLMDEVEAQIEQGAEVPEALAREIEAYLEAHRQKVDRIAGYWRWQESIAAICGREAERLLARRRAAENRVARLKGYLLAFMTARGIRKMEGEKASIGRQANSQAALVLDDRMQIPAEFQEKSLRFDRVRLRELVEQLPHGAVRARLAQELAQTNWEINEAAFVPRSSTTKRLPERGW